MRVLQLVFILIWLAIPVPSAAADVYKVCWSQYTGWVPWEYARQSGVLARWAGKYGIEIQLEQVPDYIESVEAYARGEYHACTMTQLDALTIPAAQGLDTSVIIIGDYSNGSDGILARGLDKVHQLRGRQVHLVKYSVSHYLLARALAEAGLTEADIPLVDTPDGQLLEVITQRPSAAIVTWNPILQQASQLQGVKVLYDSSDIPGEILDVLAVRTDSDERLKKALTGAWYEVMTLMRKGQQQVLTDMAAIAGVSPAAFNAQLSSLHMLFSPGIASRSAKSRATINATRRLLAFCLEHGLINTQHPVGIAFGTRAVVGDANRIRLRFDSKYMRLAAQGAL